jgi:hypothetical protein
LFTSKFVAEGTWWLLDNQTSYPAQIEMATHTGALCVVTVTALLAVGSALATGEAWPSPSCVLCSNCKNSVAIVDGSFVHSLQVRLQVQHRDGWLKWPKQAMERTPSASSLLPFLVLFQKQ